MKLANQKIEISITRKEQELLEKLSQQCKMTNAQLVKTILFDSGILSPPEGSKR